MLENASKEERSNDCNDEEKANIISNWCIFFYENEYERCFMLNRR